MSIDEVKRVSEVLRIACEKYERNTKNNRPIEAKTYIPTIVECCNLLGVNWAVLIGVESGFFYTVTDNITVTTDTLTDTLSVTNPETTVTTDNIRKLTVTEICDKCKKCNRSLKGKRQGAKFCSDACKTAYNRKKIA